MLHVLTERTPAIRDDRSQRADRGWLQDVPVVLFELLGCQRVEPRLPFVVVAVRRPSACAPAFVQAIRPSGEEAARIDPVPAR